MVEKNKNYPDFGHFVQVNGLNMYYEDHGQGDPLILIHGGLGTARFNWEKTIPVLSQQFRVIAPDCRGQGRTDNPAEKFSYRLMAEDIIALAKALDLNRPFIAGWSDGGQIALEIGINFPEFAKALVIGGAFHEVTEVYLNGMKVWGIHGPGDVNFEQLQEALPDFVKLLSDLHSPVYGSMYWKSLIVNISKMWLNPSEFPGEEVNKITTPSLVLLGDRDEAVAIDEIVKMFRLMPTAELGILPKTSHMNIGNERNELFTHVVLDFLKRNSI